MPHLFIDVTRMRKGVAQKAKPMLKKIQSRNNDRSGCVRRGCYLIEPNLNQEKGSFGFSASNAKIFCAQRVTVTRLIAKDGQRLSVDAVNWV